MKAMRLSRGLDRVLIRSVHIDSLKSWHTNSLRYPKRIFLNQIRGVVITDNSWAAEKLIKAGEKLEKGPELEPVEYDEDLVRKAPDHVKQLSSQILALNVVEVHQLMNLLQRRLGLTDADLARRMGGGVGNAAGAGGDSQGDGAASAKAPVAEPPKKEKEVFNIKLTVVDAKAKIKIIKEVRAITNLGLKEAKELVEKAPCVVKEGLKKEEAEALLKVLVDAGAQAELV